MEKKLKVDTEMRKEESVQDSKDAIAEYNDNDWYLAYVSINDIVDYRDFIEWYQKLSDDKELEWGRTLVCSSYGRRGWLLCGTKHWFLSVSVGG